MKKEYSVQRFELKHDEKGKLTQQVKKCQDFDDVETAFEFAKEEALHEWQKDVSSATLKGGIIREIRIKDTEWGYEIKHDHLTTVRYLVHDSTPTELKTL